MCHYKITLDQESLNFNIIYHTKTQFINILKNYLRS